MIICQQFKGKRIYIVGLGRTGMGAIASLLASEAKLIAWDDKPPSRDNCLIKYPGLQLFPPETLDWSKIDFILISPGIPTLAGKAHPAVEYSRKSNIPIISDIDILYLACPKAQFIGITGTNGKSTTTALIGHILTACNIKNQVGGNIGISVLELEPLDEDGVYVLEISSYQLDLMKAAKFNVAILLNITPDHLDRHGTMKNYIEAKLKIFTNQNANDKAIISIDYPITRQIINDKEQVITLSTLEKSDVYMQNRILFDEINKLKFDFNDYGFLPGRHNEENIAAAYAAAISLGLKAEEIAQSIKGFKGLPHRIEVVLDKNHVKFINDSKATNAEASEKALNCFDNIYWILGGLPKEGGIKSLAHLLNKIRYAFVIGKSQEEFSEFLDKQGCKHSKVGTLENALNEIKKMRLANCVVLFSPACASFDQFKDYEQRGDEFKRLVIKKFGD
jgi:UDP-N-acetylmuramoylalanine--D-glutamate ligase